MKPRDVSGSVEDLVKREARVSGLGDARPPTLQAVDRRRFELWSVAAFVVVALSVALVLPSLWPALPEQFAWLTPWRVRGMVAILMCGLVAYMVEKAVSLHRLRMLLGQERENVATLSSRVDQLSALLAVGKAMNSELALRDVLAVILQSAVELLQATGGSIMLVEDATHLKAVCTLSNDAARGARVQVGEGVAGRVASTLEPMVVTGPSGLAAFRPAVELDPQALSAMSVPLLSRGELLGVLNVFSGERELGEADLRPMTLFAEHAAISIVNARNYETERRRVAELLQLSRVKNRFVATMGHELRTPLSSILGSAVIMRNPSSGRLQHDESLESIERQARRMLRLIEELLISALQEEGRTPGSIERPVDLRAVVEAVARSFDQSEGSLQLFVPSHLEITGDEDIVQQILFNLLDNAYRYGAPPIRIEVEQPDGHVLISVLDAGAGVDVADRERIFERFARVDASGTYTGVGLGLPIVRQLVTACGGRVWVEDAPGGGAAFRVALPSMDASSIRTPPVGES